MDIKTINTYNRMAKEYDEETVDFWSRFPRSILDTFVNLVSGKILDIGSGPGRDGLLLKNSGLDVICLDASTEMVKIAKERGLVSIEGDFLNLPFENGSFGGVWSYTSLLHIPKSEIESAFKEISRVLNNGGVLGLGLIEGEEELYRESSGMNMERWFSFYTKEEIRNLFLKFEFEEVFFQEFRPNNKNYLNFIAIKK
jgi:ubiquinone/menaquinone biosynthesis C-methylase UbiE